MRQLISGQLSEADSELTDALQLSEKVASRILDKKTDLVRLILCNNHSMNAEQLLHSALTVELFVRSNRTPASWDTDRSAVPTPV